MLLCAVMRSYWVRWCVCVCAYTGVVNEDDHVFTSSRRSIVAECERQLHLQLMRRGVGFFSPFLFLFQQKKIIYYYRHCVAFSTTYVLLQCI